MSLNRNYLFQSVGRRRGNYLNRDTSYKYLSKLLIRLHWVVFTCTTWAVAKMIAWLKDCELTLTGYVHNSNSRLYLHPWIWLSRGSEPVDYPTQYLPDVTRPHSGQVWEIFWVLERLRMVIHGLFKDQKVIQRLFQWCPVFGGNQKLLEKGSRQHFLGSDFSESQNCSSYDQCKLHLEFWLALKCRFSDWPLSVSGGRNLEMDSPQIMRYNL